MKRGFGRGRRGRERDGSCKSYKRSGDFRYAPRAVIGELEEVIKGERTRESLRFVAFVPYNAGAAIVQKAFEARVYQNTKRVTVSGGPGDEEGTKPYVITFPDQAVAPLFVNGELPAALPSGEALSCEGALGTCTSRSQQTRGKTRSRASSRCI